MIDDSFFAYGFESKGLSRELGAGDEIFVFERHIII